MSRIFLTKNFSAIPPSELPEQLDALFDTLQQQVNAGVSISSKLNSNDPLPEGIQPRDLIFDISGGELKVGIYNGKSVVYISFGSFVGALTDIQHGDRSGGSLHSSATAIANGFLSATMYVLMNRFKGTTASGTNASLTELPTDKDWSFHNDTVLGKIFIAYNFGGTIKQLELL